MGLMFDSLLPVMLLIALGAGLTHFKVIPAEAWSGVDKLTYYALIPALMISTLSRASLEVSTMSRVGGALLAGVVIVATLTMLLRPFLLRQGVDGPGFTSVFQGAVRWNTFSALAIAGSLFGAEGTAVVAIAAAIMIPMVNVLTVAVLATYARGERLKPGAFVITLAKNPFIWSISLGLALNLIGNPVPKVLQDTLAMAGNATLAVSLIMVGGGLQLASLGRIDTPLVVASVLKLLIMPGIMVVAGLIIGLSGPTLGALIVCGSVPTASASYVLARLMGGDAPMIARIMTWQTLIAFVTMPAFLLLVG